jgi:hypothetical protein
MSEDKVCTKDLCWSVGTIYDPTELPRVSTAGPGIGRGVTFTYSDKSSLCNLIICLIWDYDSIK